MATELTTGNPERVLWRYSLPLFGSVVFQQLYNIADSVVAGKFIGENALAAVGNSYEVTLIYLAFAVGLNIGVSVVTARLFGAKRVGELKTAINTAFLFSTALCVALMAIGFLFSPALLHAIRTPDEIFSDTLLYLNIYTGGLPFLFLYNIATGIFAALGDSKTPFWFLAASSISNIALDILFVAEFHMGVAGVAWATFLCQGVSCLLAVWALLRHVSRMQADEKPRLFSMPILGSIIRIALPST
ncbi:MAG: MATE family efflux transporter, partial [Clostridia bacterium]